MKELPELEIVPGEPIAQAVRRLQEQCRERGIQLCGFETLNTSLPISRYSNFFQAWVNGKETIIVVLTEEWTNQTMVTILNILLEIRADPDPPGSRLRFKFFSPNELPPILKTLFGDHRVSELECRAAMAAFFGNDLQASDCTRLASVGLQLLKSIGIRTSFDDSDGIRRVTQFILKEIYDLKFSPDGAPLNTLICLGCLYGEMVRTKLPFNTDWAMVKEYQPWPCLVVRPPSPIERKSSKSFLGFSPIALVILQSQEGEEGILEEGKVLLEERCRQEFSSSRGGDSLDPDF